MLKSFFAAAETGGATVATRLSNPRLQSGETLRGEVRVCGGAVDQRIAKIELLLLAEAAGERGGETLLLASLPVSGPCRIPAGCEWRLPFLLPLPEATPVNCHPALGGEPLVWVHTDLALGQARDAGDSDRLQVLPPPRMDALLQAFSRVGWELAGAGVEAGIAYVGGVAGSLGCYQELELRPRDAGWNWSRIRLTLVPDSHGAVHVWMEIAGDGRDYCLSLRMEPGWEAVDWTAEIRARLGL
ncbi:sporulation protein [Chromobacterium vaccinii]|uniref:sporulation protein n=1 Tax=Chromobacterium vaccinii TaxID=1108595 RepID=UPI001E4A1EC3|nr:sporulation protein [Chromobacterium vaccinii]MCD4498445.1 sporulation protein [Chromobacterium vaccinii]